MDRPAERRHAAQRDDLVGLLGVAEFGRELGQDSPKVGQVTLGELRPDQTLDAIQVYSPGSSECSHSSGGQRHHVAATVVIARASFDESIAFETIDQASYATAAEPPP